MAKSKLVNANKKIADSVTGGFTKMSDTVTKGFGKVEDSFVDRYLTKDGESVDEAKKRLAKEKDERYAAQEERKQAHLEEVARKREGKIRH